MITPRPYQLEAVDSVYSYFGLKKGNPVIAMPTGTGKSVVIAILCMRIFESYPNQKIVIATHVKELIEQNHAKLLSIWPTAPAGIFSASVGRRDVSSITFVGIQTVAKYAAKFGHVDLLIIDECHLVGSGANTNYLQFIAGLQAFNPHIKAIGLTATPYRLGMGMVTDGGIFTDICYDLTERQTFNRMIAEGHLAHLTSRKTEVELDVSQVHKSGGEYKQDELQEAVDKAPITAAALKETIAAAADRIIFIAKG